MEQTDTLLNGYKIIQDTERFQFGIDAVLLADFAARETRNGDRVIDLGTGTGIIPLLMEKACGAASFTGLEIQKDSADMASRSVALNGLEQKIKIVNGDLKKAETLFARHSFNAVVSNPPYMVSEHGKQNAADAKAIARHEVCCMLEDVVAAADYLLLPHGKFFMIHRPFRLPEIFAAFGRHALEAKQMRLVCPFFDEEPNLVLIEARKNARAGLKIQPNLIVREKEGERRGEYTEEVLRIYGRG